MKSLSLIDLEKSLASFYNKREADSHERNFILYTGTKGAEMIQNKMELYTWFHRLDVIVPNSQSRVRLEEYLYSDDQDKVQMSKALITLKENEFNI